jgi:hypothetical protein
MSHNLKRMSEIILLGGWNSQKLLANSRTIFKMKKSSRSRRRGKGAKRYSPPKPLSNSPRSRYGIRAVCNESIGDGCVPCRSPEKRQHCFSLYSKYTNHKNTGSIRDELLGRIEYMLTCSRDCIDYGHAKRLYILLEQLQGTLPVAELNDLARSVDQIRKEYDRNGIELMDALLELYYDNVDELIDILRNFSPDTPLEHTFDDLFRYYALFRIGVERAYQSITSNGDLVSKTEQILKLHQLLFDYQDAVKTMPSELVQNIYALYYALPVNERQYISDQLYPRVDSPSDLAEELEQLQEFDDVAQQLQQLSIAEVPEVKDEYQMIDEFVDSYSSERGRIVFFERQLERFREIMQHTRDLHRYKVRAARGPLLYFGGFESFSEVTDYLLTIAIDGFDTYMTMTSSGMLLAQSGIDAERIHSLLIDLTLQFYSFVVDMNDVIGIGLTIYYRRELGWRGALTGDMWSALTFVPNNPEMIRKFLQKGKLYVTDVLYYLKISQREVADMVNLTIDDVIDFYTAIKDAQLSVRKPGNIDYFKNRADMIFKKQSQ